MTRDEQYAHVCALAGVTPDGGILPPIGGTGIDRSPYFWWKNGMTKSQMREALTQALATGSVPAEDYAGQTARLAQGPAEDFAGGPDELPPRVTSVGTRTRLLDTDSATRKLMPMASGLIDYFPDALAAVANISHRGNQKHNPGQPLHWARGKSADHADCVARHLVERGGFDKEGIRHSAQLAWRALALLQEELEAELKLTLPRGAK